MQNAQIAQVFEDIADYLEVAGENSFKIRAYRKAAEAVVNCNEAIEALAESNRLQELEGLGQATADKIREYLATGKVRYLERLKEEYPAGLLQLLRIPNFGPKKVQQVYRERGISSIEDLTLALDDGRLNDLAGFKGKTIENIRRGIERLAMVSERMPRARALALGENLREALLAIPGVEQVELAGSLRRGCDTMGDINLVAASATPDTLRAAFAGLPQVIEVKEQTEYAVIVRLYTGIQACLMCSTPEAFGAAWFLATGSRDHVATAAARAQELGLELRPDGLWRGDERVGGACETEVYDALGIAFVPPELRENDGEWEAARTGTLPQLLELADIKGDLHTHSTWSDGVHTIRQMAEAARERGYQYFAVTDHSKALAMANGLNAERLRQQALEIAEVQADFPDVTILRGVECDIMRDGSLDLDDDILHELDIVVASVHSAFNLDEATQTARMTRAITHPAVDIVAHPTGRVLGERAGYDVDVAALIEAAQKAGTALEINASERLDLCDTHAHAAREAGVPLVIDSDAHSGRMLPNVAYGVSTARRAWCRAGDILNAMDAAALKAWLQRPQAQR